MQNKHEQQLLKGIAEKDQHSFKEFVLRYQDRVRSFASHYAEKVNEQTDDLAQDIFLQVHISAGKYRGESSVKTWLYAITKNVISNKLRKKRLFYFPGFFKDSESFDDALWNDCAENTPESILMADEEAQQLQQSIDGLDQNSREVILLYHHNGFSYEQISQMLDLNIGTVKSRISQAKKKMMVHQS